MIRPSTDCTFQYCQGAAKNNVNILGGMNIGFLNCDIHGANGYGMVLNSGSHVRIVGCQFYNNSASFCMAHARTLSSRILWDPVLSRFRIARLGKLALPPPPRPTLKLPGRQTPTM